MEQFFEFVARHWILASLFVLLLIWLIISELKHSAKGLTKLSPMLAVQMMNQKETVILDVRGQSEFNSGHILNSLNVPMTQIEKQTTQLTKHKGKPVLLVSSLGQSISNTASLLQKEGFSELYALDGGLAAWQNAQLPLVKNK